MVAEQTCRKDAQPEPCSDRGSGYAVPYGRMIQSVNTMRNIAKMRPVGSIETLIFSNKEMEVTTHLPFRYHTDHDLDSLPFSVDKIGLYFDDIHLTLGGLNVERVPEKYSGSGERT